MTQASLVQMLTNRQTSDAGVPASIDGVRVKDNGKANSGNAFSGILDEKISARASETRGTSTSDSLTARRETQVRTETRRDAVTDRSTDRASEDRAAKSIGNDREEALRTDETAAKDDTSRNTSKTDTAASSAAVDEEAAAATTEAVGETQAGAQAADETETDGTETDTDMAAMLASLLQDIQSLLEERMAALKQELADGTTAADALAGLTGSAKSDELMAKLQELLGQDPAALLESLKNGDMETSDIQKLLTDLLEDDAEGAKLTAKTNSLPDRSNGNDLLHVKLQLEGMNAKFKLLQKNGMDKTETIDAVSTETGTATDTDELEAVKPADADPSDKKQDAEGQRPDNFGMQIRHLAQSKPNGNADAAGTASGAAGIAAEAINPAGKNVAEAVLKTVERPTILSEAQKQSATAQVVDRVKLMSGESKSEMELTLKPEALGKVNLKLVEERGQILARFTAESEQVKAVLESSMQLLKDALEKSGLQVSELSVSVGQQGANNRQNEAAQDDEAGNAGNGKTAAVGRISISDRLRNLPALGGYQLSERAIEYLTGGESSINLTA